MFNFVCHGECPEGLSHKRYAPQTNWDLPRYCVLKKVRDCFSYHGCSNSNHQGHPYFISFRLLMLRGATCHHTTYTFETKQFWNVNGVIFGAVCKIFFKKSKFLHSLMKFTMYSVLWGIVNETMSIIFNFSYGHNLFWQKSSNLFIILNTCYKWLPGLFFRRNCYF